MNSVVELQATELLDAEAATTHDGHVRRVGS